MSPSKDYEFVTIWLLEAPIEEIWGEISHPTRWPGWWKGVESVTELRPGDEKGVGSLHRCVWKSRLPYELAFDIQTTRVESPVAVEGVARGELEGTGRWRLSYEDGITTVRYTWKVRTTKPWMNLLAPLARPIFEWNHDVIMRQGGEGLARLLDVRLVRVEGTHQSQEALVRGLMFGLKVFTFLVGALLVLRPALVSRLLTYLKARDY
jgi:hypothetical protein